MTTVAVERLVPVADAPAPDLGPSAGGRARPGRGLLVVGVAVAVVFAGPLAYLVSRFVEVDGVVDILTARTTLVPLRSTVTLAVAVAASSAVIGTGLAWLTTRSDLPGRRAWAIAAPLPLVYPSFIGAAALLAAFAPGGLVDEVVPGIDAGSLPTIEGFWGAWFVLTLFTYPFVYLPVAARLGALSPTLEESARMLGRGPLEVARSVVGPQIAGAVWAGTLLVFLYVVSDFGAVAQLRYRTLSVEIYESRVFDQDRAIVLGVLLGALAVAVVAMERAVNRRHATMEGVRSKRPLQVPLGRWRWPAFAAVALLAANALLGPLAVLGYWAVRGLTETGRIGSADLADLAEPTVTTAALSVTAAVAAIAVVLPVAYLTTRYRSRAGGLVNIAVVSGFALPGLLVALALVYWTLSGSAWAGQLYQTVPLLIAAYVVHFGAQAMRASQVSVGSVPRRLDDAARTLGADRWRRLRSVELPLMLPGLIAGAGLVLLSTMKELPATLMLRPTEIDTLALHIWRACETAQWAETGLASLVLVALSAVLTWALVLRRAERLD
jgi:iron(III) transport system permease protein